MRRQCKRVRGDEQRPLLLRAIKCYPHVGRKKPGPSSSRRPRHPSFFVWGLAMSSWLITFPFRYAPSSIAIRGV
jgi:hypothetical protein